MTLQQDFFSLVPIAVFHCALEVGTVMAIQVLKYSILIFQAAEVGFLWWGSILNGS